MSGIGKYWSVGKLTADNDVKIITEQALINFIESLSTFNTSIINYQLDLLSKSTQGKRVYIGATLLIGSYNIANGPHSVDIHLNALKLQSVITAAITSGRSNSVNLITYLNNAVGGVLNVLAHTIIPYSNSFPYLFDIIKFKFFTSPDKSLEDHFISAIRYNRSIADQIFHTLKTRYTPDKLNTILITFVENANSMVLSNYEEVINYLIQKGANIFSVKNIDKIPDRYNKLKFICMLGYSPVSLTSDEIYYLTKAGMRNYTDTKNMNHSRLVEQHIKTIMVVMEEIFNVDIARLISKY